MDRRSSSSSSLSGRGKCTSLLTLLLIIVLFGNVALFLRLSVGQKKTSAAPVQTDQLLQILADTTRELQETQELISKAVETGKALDKDTKDRIHYLINRVTAMEEHQREYRDAQLIAQQQQEQKHFPQVQLPEENFQPQPVEPRADNLAVHDPAPFQPKQRNVAAHGSPIAILVLACNRPTVRRCLDLLIKYRPSKEAYPILVSQDCGHQATEAAIREYASHGVELVKQPDLSTPVVEADHKNFVGYYKISRHYKFALTQAFEVKGYETVIIVEDDLDIAPDFFDYFRATHNILKQDPSLWCVSGWNDNGKQSQVKDPTKIYRSDFFPGLGWMLNKQLWQEIGSKWPKAFWDDWIRMPEQRKGRTCLRPEIGRTKTFGRIGVSQGQYYDKFLKFIQLNDKPVDFLGMDLTGLLKDRYDQEYKTEVYQKSQKISIKELRSHGRTTGNTYVVLYNSNREFAQIARSLGLMEDMKSGVPRGAYMGIVSSWYQGSYVHVAPQMPWSGYTES